jgi:hypothetical protein
MPSSPLKCVQDIAAWQRHPTFFNAFRAMYADENAEKTMNVARHREARDWDDDIATRSPQRDLTVHTCEEAPLSVLAA